MYIYIYTYTYIYIYIYIYIEREREIHIVFGRTALPSAKPGVRFAPIESKDVTGAMNTNTNANTNTNTKGCDGSDESYYSATRFMRYAIRCLSSSRLCVCIYIYIYT